MRSDQILDRIVEANPKPADAQAPDSVMSKAALLAELDRRSGAIQTEEQPVLTEQAQREKRLPRSRRAAPALAGAAALIVAVVAATMLPNSSDTTRSQYADAAAAGDPLAVAGLFSDSFRTGDVDTIFEYLHPEFNPANPLFEIATDKIAYLSGWIEFEGALYGRDEAGPSTCEEGPLADGWYYCTYPEPSDTLLAAAGYTETTWGVQLVDGLVRRIDDAGILQAPTPGLRTYVGQVEEGLGQFALDADPAGSAAACDAVARPTPFQTRGVSTVYNEPCGQFLAGFADDYAATLVD